MTHPGDPAAAVPGRQAHGLVDAHAVCHRETLRRELRVEGARRRLFSTATFGTPLDVAAGELAIETFLPADAATRRWLADLLDRTRDRLCRRRLEVQRSRRPRGRRACRR